ncbi:unnamed protein product, partial [Polarella glacialis]
LRASRPGPRTRREGAVRHWAPPRRLVAAAAAVATAAACFSAFAGAPGVHEDELRWGAAWTALGSSALHRPTPWRRDKGREPLRFEAGKRPLLADLRWQGRHRTALSAEDPWELRESLRFSCRHSSGEHHSVIGDREKIRQTFREFVIFDAHQAYPEYIVWYRRK